MGYSRNPLFYNVFANTIAGIAGIARVAKARQPESVATGTRLQPAPGYTHGQCTNRNSVTFQMVSLQRARRDQNPVTKVIPAIRVGSAVLGCRVSRSPGTATRRPPRVCCSWIPHSVGSKNSNLPANSGLSCLDSAFRGVQGQQPADQLGSAVRGFRIACATWTANLACIALS